MRHGNRSKCVRNVRNGPVPPALHGSGGRRVTAGQARCGTAGMQEEGRAVRTSPVPRAPPGPRDRSAGATPRTAPMHKNLPALAGRAAIVTAAAATVVGLLPATAVAAPAAPTAPAVTPVVTMAPSPAALT